MASAPRLGLRANRRQFTFLFVLNAFVCGMVRIERNRLPVLAELEFGISKALANYATGRMAARNGRKALLMVGWSLARTVVGLLITLF